MKNESGIEKKYSEVSYTRSLLEASLDPFVTISADGKITDVNKAAEQVTGCPRETLIGSDFSDYFTSPEQARKGYLQAFVEGFVKDYPLAIRHKSGKITDVLYNASIYRNQKGEVEGVFAAARDVTERKRAEEKYRTLFNSIDEGFSVIEMIFDSNGKPSDYCFLEINEAFERQTGMHDALGKRMRSLAPNHEQHWFDIYGNVALTEQPIRFTNEAKALNRWFDVYAFPIGEEKPRKVALLFKDITEQKTIEESIRKQAALIDLSPDAIIVMDPDGDATFWSLGAQKLYGWTGSEVIGKQIHTILKTKFPEPIGKIMDKLRQTGFWSGEAVQRSKEGKEIIVQSRWSAKLDESGQIIEVLKSNVDITERKSMENEIRQTSEKLRQSNAELEQFAYVASHDLQEPLRMVASYVQLIERRYKGKLDSDADEFIGYAVDGANRMRSLIDDLLTYSRVGRLGKSFEPTDLEDTLNIVAQNLHASIADAKAQVTHDKLPVIDADGGQMVQLFQNLIGNAIKFHGKELPCVHISAREQETDYLFSVKDNGIGIDPQYFDRLFKIFQRLHTKQEYPGSGIGLVICKKIVERHGGRIWLDSQVAKGSTVYFTLAKRQKE